MKKVGIWLAAAMAAFYLTATCAFAQTAQDAGTTAAQTTAAQTESTGMPQAEETKTTATETDAETATETDAAETGNTVETEVNSAEEEDDVEEDVEEAEKPDPHAALRELLNAAELSPATAENEELDALIQEILDEVTTSEMDTYEQVKACYDYLTSNMSYSWSGGRYYKSVLDTTATALFRTDGKITGYGALALSTNSGQCNDYASGFILLTRALGLDVNLATGRTIGAGGGYIRHYWAEMELDGVRYVFDPQLEQSLARYNKGPYAVFGKTYAQVGGRYVYHGTTAV